MHRAPRYLATLAAILIAAPASGQITVGTASPNIGNCFPIGCNTNNNRFQQAYNAAKFSGPINIGAFTFFHTQYHVGIGSLAPGTYSFSFATTVNNPNFLSANFASNVSSPLQLFASFVIAPFVWGTNRTTITGSTPFYYDPALGNLLMDVQFSNPGSNNWKHFDADYTGNDDVGRVYGRDPNGTSSGNGALVTEFAAAVIATPEPATLSLLATGLVGAFGVARRRKVSRDA